MEKRKIMARENIQRIRKDLAAKIKGEEEDWQAKAGKWLLVMKRKVEVKKAEDEQAKAGRRKRTGGLSQSQPSP